MADLQSVFGSINITKDDKNKYLRVDNNYNPSWETITQESIDDSWVYKANNRKLTKIIRFNWRHCSNNAK